MTDKTILTRAIEKAERNGYNLPKGEREYQDAALIIYEGNGEYLMHFMSIIFSHDFLKAFFYPKGAIVAGGTEWQHHAQQMVLEAEPLKYIEKYL